MSKGIKTFLTSKGSLLNLPRSLKRELVRAQEEIKRIQSVPLVIGQFMEAIDQKCVMIVRMDGIIANSIKYWYCAVFYRLQLCRPHPIYA